MFFDSNLNGFFFPARNPYISCLLWSTIFCTFIIISVKQEKIKIRYYVYIIAFGLFFLFLSFEFGSNLFFYKTAKKNGDRFDKISFNSKGKTYKSDSLIRFIGETKNYLFIQDKSEQTTKTFVFKRDNVDSLYYYK